MASRERAPVEGSALRVRLEEGARHWGQKASRTAHACSVSCAAGASSTRRLSELNQAGDEAPPGSSLPCKAQTEGGWRAPDNTEASSDTSIIPYKTICQMRHYAFSTHCVPLQHVGMRSTTACCHAFRLDTFWYDTFLCIPTECDATRSDRTRLAMNSKYNVFRNAF